MRPIKYRKLWLILLIISVLGIFLVKGITNTIFYNQELERPKLRYQNIQRSDIQRAVLDYGRRNHQLTENELEELIEILHEIVVYSLDPVDDKYCSSVDYSIKLYTKDGNVTELMPMGGLLVENGVIIRCEYETSYRLNGFLGGLRDQYFSSPLW